MALWHEGGIVALRHSPQALGAEGGIATLRHCVEGFDPLLIHGNEMTRKPISCNLKINTDAVQGY